MRKYFLSVYFGYHDSCITISSDKEILLHLEAERVFRKKHMRVDKERMVELIKIGLFYLKITIDEISKLYLARWNNQFGEGKINILGRYFQPILTSHHENHIGTGLVSGFKEAVIVCADGGSEDGTTRVYLKKGSKISFLEDLDDTPMTGKFYGTLTQMIIEPRFGRAHDTAPGKMMGLAATGVLSKEFYQLLEKYWPEINKLHFKGCEHLLNIFRLKPKYSAPWRDKRRMNLAYTAQKFWERKFCSKLKLYRKYSENIILVGGCAYNISLNSLIADSKLYKRVYITPVSGDCGQSLGAIIFYNPGIICNYPFLGRSFGKIDDCANLDEIIKDLLNHKIICWHQGRSEIGPRALGHRSFIGLADSVKMSWRLNTKIKRREPYRPVAPIVAEEFLEEFFETKQKSPFMTFAPRAKKKTIRFAPAIIHSDETSRIQTVSIEDNPIMHEILIRIMKVQGVPILMNSSLNIKGYPIVDSPKDTLNTFRMSGADVCYINGKRYDK